MMRWHLLAVAVVLVSVGGCGSGLGGRHPAASPTSASTSAVNSRDDTSSVSSTIAHVSILPARLVGAWSTVFTTEDWAHAGGYPAGTWTIDARRDGQVSVFLPHTTTPDFVTSFEVTDSTLSIGNSPVCRPSPARYRWSATPTTLTIVVVSDACAARAVLFGQTWQRHK
jgi:hypothetical protein